MEKLKIDNVTMDKLKSIINDANPVIVDNGDVSAVIYPFNRKEISESEIRMIVDVINRRESVKREGWLDL